MTSLRDTDEPGNPGAGALPSGPGGAAQAKAPAPAGSHAPGLARLAGVITMVRRHWLMSLLLAAGLPLAESSFIFAATAAPAVTAAAATPMNARREYLAKEVMPSLFPRSNNGTK